MQIDKKFPIHRPLSQLSVTFVEFILLYEPVKNEATGTHYCQVTATFTSTCNIDKNSVCRWLSILLSTQIRRPCAHTRALTTRGESIASLWSYSDFTSNVQQRMRRRKLMKKPFYSLLFRLSSICGHRYCNNTDTLRKGRSTSESLGSYSDLALTCKIHNKPLCRRLSINLFTNRRIFHLGELARQRRT